MPKKTISSEERLIDLLLKDFSKLYGEFKFSRRIKKIHNESVREVFKFELNELMAKISNKYDEYIQHEKNEAKKKLVDKEEKLKIYTANKNKTKKQINDEIAKYKAELLSDDFQEI